MEITNGTNVQDKASKRKMVVLHIVGAPDVSEYYKKREALHKALIAPGDFFCSWGSGKEENNYFKPHQLINLDENKAKKVEEFLKGKQFKIDGNETSFQDAIVKLKLDLDLNLLAEELTQLGLGD